MALSYVCFTNQNPTFGPAMRIISAITNGNPAQVTTTINHGYVNGTIVRLDIPPACGMQEASGLFAGIIVNNPNTFLIDIDTTLFAPFSIPVGVPPTVDICAQAVPIGELNETLLAALQNILGSQIQI
jgi:hypothetical protein